MPHIVRGPDGSMRVVQDAGAGGTAASRVPRAVGSPGGRGTVGPGAAAGRRLKIIRGRPSDGLRIRPMPGEGGGVTLP